MNRNKNTDIHTWFRVLSDLISKTELFLKTAPEGSIWSSKRNNGTFQYYYVQPGTRMRVFIRQNDMSIARELAQKKYVLMLNKIAIHGMNRLKMTEVFTELDLYGIYDEAYYQLSEGLRILVKPWKEPRDVFLETWASQTYEPLEHMGIVDNEHYASNAMKKLMIYEQNDIFINDRLILTYETANDPLNLRTINDIIDQIEYMLK